MLVMMAKYEKSLLFLINILLCLNLVHADTKMVIKKVAQCENENDLNFMFHYIKTEIYDSDEFIANYSYTIHQTFGKNQNLNLVISARQCPEMENPDSCEYLLKDTEFNDVCTAIGLDNQIWTEFAKSADIIECPVKPKTITRENFRFSNDILTLIPELTPSLWLIDFRILDDGILSACAVLEIVVSVL